MINKELENDYPIMEEIMLKGIIDTHCHMDDPCFADRLDQMLEEQQEAGVVAIMNSGSELPSSLRSCEMAEKYDMVYASVGIYPNETANLPEDYIETLRRYAKRKKVVAIGEIGMDYGYEEHPDPAIQEKCFREQLVLAEELDLPVVIHNREADEDTLRILKDYHIRGAIHRIFSPIEYAREFIKMGIYMGFGPQITYPGSDGLVQLARECPKELILLETDAPFLPNYGMEMPATPDMIAKVAETISEIRGDMTPQEVVDTARENAARLYHIAC